MSTTGQCSCPDPGGGGGDAAVAADQPRRGQDRGEDEEGDVEKAQWPAALELRRQVTGSKGPGRGEGDGGAARGWEKRSLRGGAFFYLREIEVFPEAERQQLIAQQLIARHQTDAGTRTWQHEIDEQYLNSNQNAERARNLGALWSCIL